MDLEHTIRRALDLDERIRFRDHHLDREIADLEGARARLQTWSQGIAQGEPEVFERRLRWVGLTPAQATKLLTDEPVEVPTHTLRWASYLRTLHASLPSPELAAELAALGLAAAAARPFSHLIDPICAFARRRVRAKLRGDATPGAPVSPRLSVEAQVELDGILGTRLAFVMIRALHEQFRARLPLGATLALFLDGEAGTTHYDAFVRSSLAEGLLSFFHEYPGAARLIAEVVEAFEETVIELVERLEADATALEAFTARPWSKVASIHGGISDPHNRGRSVLILALDGGAKVVYKPRPLGLEAAYAELLAWLSQDPRLLPLRAAAVLDRGDYGWAEFIRAEGCDSEAEVRRYHRRAGMLLGVFHMLGGNDCHFENVIARGEYPCVIDLETLVRHEMHGVEITDTSATGRALELLRESVLTTGLLPRWQYNEVSGLSFDVSGLGSRSVQAMSAIARRWRDVNTDRMSMTTTTEVPASAGHNLPILGGVRLEAADFVPEIRAGFQAMYEVLSSRREELLAGPLRSFERCEVRMLFRQTKVYGQLLESSYSPQFLRHGAGRSLRFEGLGRVFVTVEEPQPDWPVFLAEVRALEGGDIPHFSAGAATTTLERGVPEPIEGYFRMSATDRARRRLDRFGPDDLAVQTSLIEGSFAARRTESEDDRDLDRDPAPLSRQALAEEARLVAEDLARRALRGDDGSATWIGLTFDPRSERFDLNLIGPNLYDGTAGVALFLAAYGRTTGDLRFESLARGAVASARRLLRREGGGASALARSFGVGGASGVGSLIYALTRMSALGLDDALLDDARSAAAALTDELIALDTGLDVMSGSAGAVLSLLRLYEATRDPTVLERATACGDHLLRTQIDGAWRTVGGRRLTGFSHGASGIALALSELAAATGRDEYARAAARAIEYEDGLFSEEDRNWPDLRDGARRAHGSSWCHGAPGIGLARVNAGLGSRLSDLALESTVDPELQAIDNLCCGNLGRAEIAMSSGRTLARPDLEARGRRLVDACVARARRRGAYNWVGNISETVFVPGLFKGAAGLGYTLLRVLDPTLPSVVSWR